MTILPYLFELNCLQIFQRHSSKKTNKWNQIKELHFEHAENLETMSWSDFQWVSKPRWRARRKRADLGSGEPQRLHHHLVSHLSGRFIWRPSCNSSSPLPLALLACLLPRGTVRRASHGFTSSIPYGWVNKTLVAGNLRGGGYNFRTGFQGTLFFSLIKMTQAWVEFK